MSATVAAPIAATARDRVEEAVRSGFELLLGVENPSDDDDFFELGGDSMVALSLLLHIEEHTGKTLPVTALYDATTIATLTDLLMNGNASGRDPTLVELRPAKKLHAGPPLFLLHGLGGSVMILRDFARQIGGERAVWGIEAVGLDGSCAPLEDVHEMAADAVRKIRGIAPHGPYLLAGYSFGGVVALEIARRLEAEGEKIALLAMLDTFPHPTTWPLPAKFMAFVRQVKVYFSFIVWSRLIRREFDKLRGRSPLVVVQRLCRGAVRAITLPGDILGTAWVYDLAGRAPKPAEMLVPLDPSTVTAENYETIEAVIAAARRAFRAYKPTPYRGALLVVHATLRQVIPFNPKSVWRHLVGSLTVIDLPTDHQALVRNDCKPTAECLTRAIEAALGKAPS
jgi:acetoacetyl-CoA synthetase